MMRPFLQSPLLDGANGKLLGTIIPIDNVRTSVLFLHFSFRLLTTIRELFVFYLTLRWNIKRSRNGNLS